MAYASLQETDEVPFKSEICVVAGQPPIEKVVYVSQDELTAALIAGEVDAISADSPVIGFAVKTSGGGCRRRARCSTRRRTVGRWPSGSALATSLRQALEHLMSTGEYRTIATMWGVEKGMIDRPEITVAAG